MKKVLCGCLSVILVLVAFGLWLIYQFGPHYNIHLVPPSPEKYGLIALQQMDSLGLYAQGEDWDSLKSETAEQLKTSKSYQESRDLLKPALKLAGGKHSYFLTEADLAASTQESQEPTSQVLEGDLLYLQLTDILTADKGQLTNYATTLQTALDQPGLRGVIIDLRDNRGGNMYPMLAGLSSLLPDDDLVRFENRTGDQMTISLKEVGNWSGIPLAEEKQDLPVAILTSDYTASSAEIVAMSFQGLDRVRVFGQPTAGFTTSNQNFPLYDGTDLVLTTSRLVSRTGQTYDNDPIQPDVLTDQPKEEAVAWLQASS